MKATYLPHVGPAATLVVNVADMSATCRPTPTSLVTSCDQRNEARYTSEFQNG